MPKRIIIITLAIATCWLLVRLMWLRAQMHSSSQIGIAFVGVTNNAAGLLGTSDRVLAVFSVSNGAGSPIEDAGFYYIEMSGNWWTYSPLGSGSPMGSGGRIAPHGCGTILTRIPTNGVPWRVIVPYSRTTRLSQIVEGVRDALDRAVKRPSFDFDRYGRGAPRSNWVKP